MAARAPEPSAIMAITEATPMITPSMVSMERILLRRMARTAMRTVLPTSMLGLHLERGKGRELLRGLAPPGHRRVRHHAPVAEGDDALRVLGDVGLVGDEDDGDAALAVQ